MDQSFVGAVSAGHFLPCAPPTRAGGRGPQLPGGAHHEPVYFKLSEALDGLGVEESPSEVAQRVARASLQDSLAQNPAEASVLAAAEVDIQEDSFAVEGVEGGGTLMVGEVVSTSATQATKRPYIKSIHSYNNSEESLQCTAR